MAGDTRMGKVLAIAEKAIPTFYEMGALYIALTCGGGGRGGGVWAPKLFSMGFESAHLFI